jgi:HEPN domain-containing protein
VSGRDKKWIQFWLSAPRFLKALPMNRWRDWLEQSLRDLRHAGHALDDADFEWAAFAAQQAAEEVVKCLILAHGGEPWGHLITRLVEALPESLRAPSEAIEAANRLDKHYIPARYPNGFVEGYPAMLYTRGEAEGAIADAKKITDFCRRHLPG